MTEDVKKHGMQLRIFEKLLDTNNQKEWIIEHRGRSWAVIKDVGEHGPATEFGVFEGLLNIKNQIEDYSTP